MMMMMIINDTLSDPNLIMMVVMVLGLKKQKKKKTQVPNLGQHLGTASLRPVQYTACKAHSHESSAR